MLRAMVVVALCGLGGGCAGAQTVGGGGCPVEFGVAVRAGVVVRSVGRGATPATGPTLEMNFGEGARRVVAASVVVHGFSSDGRLLPVAGVNGGRGEPARELQERFEVRAAGEGALRRREVDVRAMRVVRWAELAEVRYADGSGWRPAAGERCRAVPSGFHLVGAE